MAVRINKVNKKRKTRMEYFRDIKRDVISTLLILLIFVLITLSILGIFHLPIFIK